MSSLAMGYVNIVKHKVNNRCGKSRWLGEDCVGHVLTLRQYKYYQSSLSYPAIQNKIIFRTYSRGYWSDLCIPFQFEQ